MKAIILILAASSAYVNGQINFIGKFKGQASLQNQPTSQSQGQVHNVEGLVHGQISVPTNQIAQGVLTHGQPIQGHFESFQVQNVPQIQGSVSDFLSRFNTLQNGQSFQNALPNYSVNVNENVQNFPILSDSVPRPFALPANLPLVPSLPHPQQHIAVSANVLPQQHVPVSENVPSIPPQQHVPVSENVPSIPPRQHVPVLENVPNSPILNDPVPVVSEESPAPERDDEWEEFKIKYGKSYGSAAEEAHRKQLYYSNKGQIIDFNAKQVGFGLGINKFGDLTVNEFNNQYNGLTLNSKRNNGSSYIPSGFVAKPKLVDWRNFTGAVTDVKDQGDCYSCWAFTAAAVLESHWWRKTGETVDISEQNILDCRTDDEKDSCAPGYYTTAWEYIRDNKGVDGEEIYPYQSHHNENFTCRFKPEGVVAKVTGIVELPEKDEGAMELAVASQGPIAAAIDANIFAQQFYSDGVFKGVEKDNSGNYLNAQCTEEVNHAVTIVGFGEEEDGQKYWLIKNSYGPSWGQNGYMKLARGENACGISLNTAYPLV